MMKPNIGHDEQCAQEDVSRELKLLLASPFFPEGSLQSLFLDHVVKMELKGDGAFLKESTIGIEIFRLPGGTNYKKNSTVRRAARLSRRAIAQYYRTLGSAHQVRIVVQKGSYRPLFCRQPVASEPALPTGHITIAVHPSQCFPNSSRLKPLAQDLQEMLVDDLSQLQPIMTVEASPAFPLKDARAQGFDYVLQPGLTQIDMAETQQLTIALSDATGYVRLIENTIRPAAEWRQLTRDVAERLSGRINSLANSIGFTPTERCMLNSTLLEILEGESYLEMRTHQGVARAAEIFGRMVERHPNDPYVLARAAETLLVFHYYRPVAASECWARAYGLAQAAIRYGPDLSEAHTAMAYSALLHTRRLDIAQEHFDKALALKPSNHRALQWLTNKYAMTGDLDKAVETARAAYKAAPDAPMILKVQGDAAYFGGRVGEAIALYSIAIELRDNWMTRLFRGLAYEQRAGAGEFRRALEDFHKSLEMNPYARHIVDGARGHLFALDGNEKRARELLHSLQASRRPGSAYSIAAIYAGLNDVDAAIAWLKTSLHDPIELLFWVARDRRFMKLRENPCFPGILSTLGLNVPVNVNEPLIA